jgi:3-phenylpropionate/trans-cinnamate dioxygenase ferredoxin reductase subunit
VTETFVVVGAGFAGAKAVETLREEGFAGRIVLAGEEPERPYERPPLSKDYLRGEAARETIYVHGSDWYAEHDVELRLGAPVASLDVAARSLELAGERLGYDALLLATGAAPKRLPVPGAEKDGILYLRGVADADALRARLARGGSVLVVGGGWIGCEVAASARMSGLEVTVVEPQSLPLEGVLGPELGAIYRDIHADHGVRLRLGTGVTAFEGAGAVERVRLSDGSAVDCDFVVVGVGVRPRTDLAVRAGIPVGDGILADERLATGAPGVFAAGDVAAALHPFYGERIRVEHWANALEQGPHAARSMLGATAPYDRLPYFFSDQYDVGMEYAGFARRWDRVVFRGDVAAREFVAFWLDGDRVVAGMNVNVWGVVDQVQRLIRERVPVEDRRLADPDVALEDLTPIGRETA